MATQIKRPDEDLYDRDFYAWAERQAELLHAGRLDELDLENLILEVEGLADVKRSAVLNNARVTIEHLLKLEHSPAQAPRQGWADSVFEHRSRLEIDLTPRLQQILENELAEVYRLARLTPRPHHAGTASPQLLTRCPRPAPTASSRSPRLAAVTRDPALNP